MSSIEVRGHNFGAISVKAEIEEHFVNHKSELQAKINMARELVSAAYDILYSINRSDGLFNAMIREYIGGSK